MTSTGFPADGIRFFCNEIEERSNGQLIVEPYFDSSLGFKVPDSCSSISQGLGEFATVCPGMSEVEVPVIGVYALPFLFENVETRTAWCNSSFIPAMDKQAREKWNVSIFGFTLDPSPILIFSEEEVRNVDDLEGLKIRTWGGVPHEALLLLGCDPFVVSTSDIYTGLQSGLIKAAITSYQSATECSFWEVLNYTNNIPLFRNSFFLAMNLDAYNELPSDVQKAVLDSEKAYVDWHASNRDAYGETLHKMLLDGGMEDTYPEAGAMDQMAEICKPLYKKIADEAGPEAVKLLQDLGKY